MRAGVDNIFTRRKCSYRFTEEWTVGDTDAERFFLSVLSHFIDPVICAQIEGFCSSILIVFLGNLGLVRGWVNTDSDCLKSLTNSIRQNNFMVKFQQPSSHLAGLSANLSAGIEKHTATDKQNQDGCDAALILLFERERIPKKSEDVGETEPENERHQHV